MSDSYLRGFSCLLVVFFLSHVALSSAAAQDESTADTTAAEKDDNDGIREQTIYIPYEKLRETFEKKGRGVFLPYEKFQELWTAARDKQTPLVDTQSPVKSLITEVDNKAVVANDVVRVEALVKIDLLVKGWLKVPLRLSNAAVLSATIDDQPARLVPADDGGQILLVENETDEVRQIDLRIEYAKNFTKSPGQNSVSFDAPRAAVNRWRITIPEAGVKVNVQPLLAASEVPAGQAAGDNNVHTDSDPSTSNNETVVLAFVGAAPTVRIDWTPKAEGASGLDALVSVQTEQQMSIDEGVTRTSAHLSYEISRSELDTLTIRVPGDHKVVNVLDANVRQWNVETVADGQQITARLFEPARDRQDITVELEKFRDETGMGELTVPQVAAVNVGRQRGVLVVRMAAGLRAEVVSRTGLMQLDTAEIPTSLSRESWAFSYRYATLPYNLTLRLEKIQPRIAVDQLVEAFLEPQKLTLDLFAKYQIERAGVFELRVNVPAEFEVRGVRGRAAAGAQAAAVESYTIGESYTIVESNTGEENQHKQLVVNLASKALGNVGLLVELEKRLQDPNLLSPTGESAVLTLVAAQVAGDGIQHAEGRLVVYAPESLRVGTNTSTGLRPIGFDEAFAGMESVRGTRFASLRPVLAYAFGEAIGTVELTAARRRPQVTAHQLLVARIEPGVVKYQATLRYDIRYSGVKSLRLDVPAELAAVIRNETPQLREATLEPAPANTPAEYVAWEFRGESELIGVHQFTLNWETTIEDLSIGNSVDLAVPRLIPRDVDRVEGQIVLVKSESIDVRPKGEPVGLDPIDPQHDLTGGVQIANAAAALEFHEDWELTLTATRYELEVLKHTSIERAVLRMVITRSDRISVQALYRMRSNRQRLEIKLPFEVVAGQIEFDTDPLRINGRGVALEHGGDKQTFFVPLVGHNTNEPFLLDLRYTMPGSGTTLTYPYFPAEPAVQMVHLIAYTPRERTLLGSRGPWTNETRSTTWELLPGVRSSSPNIDTLIAQLTTGISIAGSPAGDFPVDGKPLVFSTLRPDSPDHGALHLSTLNQNGLQIGVFLVVLLPGIVLLKHSLADRTVVVLAALAVLVLVGVFLPTFARSVLDVPLLLAAVLVGLLWLAVGAAHGLPKLSQIDIRWPRRRNSTKSKTDKSTSKLNAPSPGTPEPTVDKSDSTEGGDDHE